MVKLLFWKKETRTRPLVRKEHVTALSLTILYIVEVCLGVRTVVYVFDVWNRARLSPPFSDDISWAMVAVSLTLCVCTCCSVNAVSALWDCKDYDDMKSAIYFCFHILTGGIPTRFVNMWKSESAEAEKENVMLMACLKFMFSQLFSIPLMVIHVYLEYELTEFLYDAITIFSMTMTFALTCSAIHNFPVDVEYPHHTMALVPLIFKKKPDEEEVTNTEQSKHESVGPTDQQQETGGSHWKQKIATVVQYMLFSIGRILALGVLLKLTGIYALPIIFLQFLLSVLYLKFQAVHLVPESLSKPKQLMRLAFLSYVLVFEWQLHREPHTGYNLGSYLRHGVLYYFIATAESVFYLVVWLVTYKPHAFIFMDVGTVQRDYVLWVTIIASLSLLISNAIHACLIFLRYGSKELLCKQPREYIHRASAVILNIRRASTKTNSEGNDMHEANVADASEKSEDIHESEQESMQQNRTKSKRSNSYRDLSDNVDENVEVTQHKMTYPARLKQESTLVKNPCDFQSDQVQKTVQEFEPYQSNKISSSSKALHNCMVANTVSLAKSPFTAGELKAINESHPTEPSKSNTGGRLSSYIQIKNFKSPYNLKGLKDSNFFKNLRSPKKSSSPKSSPNTKPSRGNFDVIKKVSSMTNTVSTQLAKKLSTGTRVNKTKTDDEPKKDPDGNKIVISTIMNEYKEELPENYDTCIRDKAADVVAGTSSNDTEDDGLTSWPIANQRKATVPERTTRPVKSARWRPADSGIDNDPPKLTDNNTERSSDYEYDDKESGYTQDVTGSMTPPPDFHECSASDKKCTPQIDNVPPVPKTAPPPPPPSRCRKLLPSSAEVSIDCEDEDEDVIYDSTEYERFDQYCDNGVGTIGDGAQGMSTNTGENDEYVERFV